MSPPNAKRRLWRTALQKVQLLRAYHTLDLRQAPFGFVFWLLEQRKAKLQDCIENGRHG